MKKTTHTPIRLWAVLLWLLLWQVASMRLNLPVLLPSPAEALQSLAAMALTV